MRRREILTTSVACLVFPGTGCLSASQGNDAMLARVETIDADEPPELPVVPAISVVNEKATESTPATISVSWQNEGAESVRLAEQRSAVFRTARSDDETAYLLGGDRGDVVAFDGCWYLSGAIGGDAAYRSVKLDPGETYEGQSSLYAATDDCLTATEYRFQTDVTVWRPDESEEDGRSEEWGFVLDVRTTES